MSESMDEDIRVYSFPTSGYIPGVPGVWPGGSRVTVRESTREVLDIWPKPVSAITLTGQDESGQTVSETIDLSNGASYSQNTYSALGTPPAQPIQQAG